MPAKLVRALRAYAPEYGVALREMIGDPFGALRRGEVDAVLGTVVGSEPGLLAGPVLGSEVVVLAAPHDHALAGRSSGSTHDFETERLHELIGPDSGRRTVPTRRAGPPAPTRMRRTRSCGPGTNCWRWWRQARASLC